MNKSNDNETFFEMEFNEEVGLMLNPLYMFTDILYTGKIDFPMYFLEEEIEVSEEFEVIDVRDLRNEQGKTVIIGQLIESLVLTLETKYLIVHADNVKFLKEIQNWKIDGEE